MVLIDGVKVSIALPLPYNEQSTAPTLPNDDELTRFSIALCTGSTPATLA